MDNSYYFVTNITYQIANIVIEIEVETNHIRWSILRISIADSNSNPFVPPPPYFINDYFHKTPNKLFKRTS